MSNPSITRKKAVDRMQATIDYLEQHKQVDSIADLYRSVPELRRYKSYVEARGFIQRMHKLGLIQFNKGYRTANVITLNKSSDLIDRIKQQLPFDGINKAINRQLVYRYAKRSLYSKKQPKILILGGPYLHDIPEILKYNPGTQIDSIEHNIHSYVCAAVKARAAYKNNVHVHHENIYEFLWDTKNKYDLIYLDYCGKVKAEEGKTIELALSKLHHGGQLAITMMRARGTTKYIKDKKDKAEDQIDAVWRVIKDMAKELNINYYPVATIKYCDVVSMATLVLHKGLQTKTYDELVVKDGQVNVHI